MGAAAILLLPTTFLSLGSVLLLLILYFLILFPGSVSRKTNGNSMSGSRAVVVVRQFQMREMRKRAASGASVFPGIVCFQILV